MRGLTVIALCLLGCSDLLGADFDRASTSPAPTSGEVLPSLPGDVTEDVTKGSVDPGAEHGVPAVKDPGSKNPRPAASEAAWRVELIETVVPELRSIIGRGPDDLFISGGSTNGGILHSTGDGNWQAQSILSSDQRYPTEFALAPDGKLVVACQIMSRPTADDRPLMQLDLLNRWQPMRVADGSFHYFLNAALLQGGELFAADLTNEVQHFANGTWTSENTGISTIGRVWTFGGQVFAIGTNGRIAQRGDDRYWRTLQSKDGPVVKAVWGRGTNDFYVVGANGYIGHSRDMQTFDRLTSGTEDDLRGIFGVGDDVWIVGEHGTILHAGKDDVFTPMTSGTDVLLTSVWASSASNVYAVGHDLKTLAGVILRYAKSAK